MTHRKSNYKIYVNFKFSYWGSLVWLVLGALTAVSDQRSSVDFKPINQSINHNFTKARGTTNQPTNQSTNQSPTTYFCHDTLRSEAPENTTPKVQYGCLLIIKIWGMKCGKILDFGQNWKSVGSRPKQVGKICPFISPKCLRPRRANS